MQTRTTLTRTFIFIAISTLIFGLSTTTSKALTQKEEKAKAYVVKEIKKLNDKIDTEEFQLTRKEMQNVNDEIYYQTPEIFFISGIRYGMNIKTDRCVYFKPKYLYDKKTITKKIKALNKIVNSYKPTGTIKQKIEKIHNYIIKRTVYKKLEKTDDVYNAYGALVSKKAVCQGYASAFKLLCDKQKIPCKMVMNQKKNHAWNVVKVGKKWYNVDVTWDDKGSTARKTYFMVKDSKLKKENRKHDGPKCI